MERVQRDPLATFHASFRRFAAVPHHGPRRRILDSQRFTDHSPTSPMMGKLANIAADISQRFTLHSDASPGSFQLASCSSSWPRNVSQFTHPLRLACSGASAPRILHSQRFIFHSPTSPCRKTDWANWTGHSQRFTDHSPTSPVYRRNRPWLCSSRNVSLITRPLHLTAALAVSFRAESRNVSLITRPLHRQLRRELTARLGCSQRFTDHSPTSPPSS